jgi:hypothetical protein
MMQKVSLMRPRHQVPQLVPAAGAPRVAPEILMHDSSGSKVDANDIDQPSAFVRVKHQHHPRHNDDDDPRMAPKHTVASFCILLETMVLETNRKDKHAEP